MFKTIYRLRILVKDRYHSVDLYALKEKEPTFLDLLKKVQRITEDTNVLLNDYHLATIDTKTIVSDDQSLRSALKSCTRLDITLERKRQLKRKMSTLDTPTILPIIKPTVLRWTPAIILPPSNVSHVRLNQHQDDNDSLCRKDNIRKDSGISLFDQQEDNDEPRQPYKKQRVHSADFSSRHYYHKYQKPTLPALSSITCLPPLLNSQQQQQHLPPIQQQQQSSSSIHSECINKNTITTTTTTAITTATRTNVFLCEHVTQGKRCGQTFRRSYDLSRHQTIHLPNRQFFYCQQCRKKFTRMDALRRHERVQGHAASKQQQQQQQQKRSMSLPTGQAGV